MDYTKEFRKMLDYRQRLIESAKPGWGSFSFFNELMETTYKDLLDDPETISGCDDNDKAFLFDYFIAIPLCEFAKCRNEYISPGSISSSLEELKSFIQDGSFSEEELRLLPDLFHDSLRPSNDMTKDEREGLKSVRKAFKDIFKKLFSPGDIDEETVSTIISRIADVGCQQALHCFALKADDRYKEFEWEIVERVLRSPFFPDFYDECEKAAASPDSVFDWETYVKNRVSNQCAVPESQPEVQTEKPEGDWNPSDYQWPARDFFTKVKSGIGVKYYVPSLSPQIEADLTGDDGDYEHFKMFINDLVSWGKLNKDSEISALLQYITGRKFENASEQLRWDGEGKTSNARTLFYVVQYISALKTKNKYYALMDSTFAVFSNINEKEQKIFQPQNLKVADSPDIANKIQDGRGVDKNRRDTLHNHYEDVFPAPKQK